MGPKKRAQADEQTVDVRRLTHEEVARVLSADDIPEDDDEEDYDSIDEFEALIEDEDFL